MTATDLGACFVLGRSGARRPLEPLQPRHVVLRCGLRGRARQLEVLCRRRARLPTAAAARVFLRSHADISSSARFHMIDRNRLERAHALLLLLRRLLLCDGGAEHAQDTALQEARERRQEGWRRVRCHIRPWLVSTSYLPHDGLLSLLLLLLFRKKEVINTPVGAGMNPQGAILYSQLLPPPPLSLALSLSRFRTARGWYSACRALGYKATVGAPLGVAPFISFAAAGLFYLFAEFVLETQPYDLSAVLLLAVPALVFCVRSGRAPVLV